MPGFVSSLTLGFGVLQLVNAATHSFDFHVGRKDIEVSPGVFKSKTVVNGQFPGPLVRVPYMAEVQMNVHNELNNNGTTIHWHGMHQRGTPYSDGFPEQSQCPIPSNHTMAYNFRADPAGSTFWHAHFHEESIDGVYGPFIVEDQPGTFPFSYDEENVILMTDAYNSTSWIVEYNYNQTLHGFGNGSRADPAPDQGFMCLYDEKTGKPSCSSTTGGEGFDLHFEKGKTYRLRLICSASLAPFLFSIDGHEMQVASVDYQDTDGSAWVKGVPMMTGQRYDVIVRAHDDVKDGEQFWVRGTMQGDCNEFTSDTLIQDVRGILTYGAKTPKKHSPKTTGWNVTNQGCVDLDYSTLRPAKYLLPSLPSVEDPALTMYLNFTFPSIINNVPEILINGNHYNVSDDAYPTLFHVQENPSWKPTVEGEQRNLLTIPDSVRNKQVRLVLRTITAPGGGGHPFHAHGRGFKVLAIGSGNFTQSVLDNITDDDVKNAISRDTVVVPRLGYVVTQFEANNPGVWAMHCHIAWHIGHGMLGQIIELPKAISEEIVIPQQLKDMCPR